jgi:hypothetical protein
MTDSAFQDSTQEKDNMIATRVYLPSTLDYYADSLAQSIGCSKSELLRHAIFHGLSVYAERSNKYRINARMTNTD